MNKCVIKTAEGDGEIENTKSHLSKLSHDIKRLTKIFADENIFYMRHLVAFFQEPVLPTSTITNENFRGVLEEIQNVSKKNKEPEIYQAVLEHTFNVLEDQFRDIGKDVFENSQIPQTNFKKAKPLNTNLSNLFKKHDSQNFKYYLQNIEELWKVLSTKPSEVLPKIFQCQSVLHLGGLVNSSIIAHSHQVSLSKLFIIFLGKCRRIIGGCLHS